ncbi:uncharacterized protein si:dkeyp-97b10.3 isoform X3 [Anguilla rostrata]|uniref:uncharacterized protein si:dkeyp-97b10.3 isoform X3 n=1 Tax=Anguilla rostrata TaxID=7938 RepID=UPI0030D0BD6B
MVAEMTSFGSSKCFEESDRDISPPDQKGNVAENESSSSSSENTEASTEESSEDECSADGDAAEDDKEEEKENSDVGGFGHDQDPVPETSTEGPGPDGTASPPLRCEKCQLVQDRGFEHVTPRRISRGRLLALLDGEGTYECSVTGLVFEVTQKAQVRYSVLSWSKFGAYLKDSWKFAGPVFDVDCDPSILTSIQFPHSLCLAGQDGEVTFSVLHVKSGRGLVEPSAGHSGNRVTWRVTSLSPVGPIVRTPQPAEHHGVVLVYRELGTRAAASSFHIYMAANNSSDIKDIQKEVRIAKKRFVKMDKPATCLLEEQKKYQLISEPEGEINPENLKFTQAVVKMKSYFEVFLEQPPPFKLSLVEVESNQTVWSATLREGDFVDNATEKPRKKAESRKRSCSTSEEEVAISKRARHGDVPDGVMKTPGLTDQQLMMVATRMGKEWKQLGILYLGMSMQDIEEIQAADDDLAVVKFKMLDRWRRKAKGGAGISLLCSSLSHDNVPNELRDLLEDMLSNPSAK